jgi:uncharacterized protein involved in oxidation of intracellular sulfur
MTTEVSAMQILVVVSSSDPEVKWNALRFSNLLLNEGEEVTVFLNGPAVDLAAGETGRLDLSTQAKLFGLSEGVLLA